jgi:hypothetical protein
MGKEDGMEKKDGVKKGKNYSKNRYLRAEELYEAKHDLNYISKETGIEIEELKVLFKEKK